MRPGRATESSEIVLRTVTQSPIDSRNRDRIKSFIYLLFMRS